MKPDYQDKIKFLILNPYPLPASIRVLLSMMVKRFAYRIFGADFFLQRLEKSLEYNKRQLSLDSRYFCAII